MIESDFKFELRDDGVLIVHPHGPLRKQDFDKLAELVDPWIRMNHELQGIVVSVEKFPGWENLKSLIRARCQMPAAGRAFVARR